MSPIKDADGNIIGWNIDPLPAADEPTLEPVWKDWKGGDYDDSDGKFVEEKSHVVMLFDGRIGRASGTSWDGLVQKYRRAIPSDMDNYGTA